MKNIVRIIFSLKTAVVLMVIFAVAIAWATFIENDFGTESAKKLIYVSFWFELLLWLIAINLIGNMFLHKLFTRKKWTILIFHLAFLLILGGGAITRHLGFEGVMHIREGATANTISLSYTYLKVKASQNGTTNVVSKKIRLTQKGSNKFKAKVAVGNQIVKVETVEYLPSVVSTIVEANDGIPGISLFIMDDFKRGHEHDLLKDESAKVGRFKYAFGKDESALIQFGIENGVPTMMSKFEIAESNMMSGDTLFLEPNIAHVLKQKVIYRCSGQVFVVKAYYQHAEKVLQPAELSNLSKQGLVARVELEGKIKTVQLVNQNGIGFPEIVNFGDVEVELEYGYKDYQLPFALKLNDFELERYPGSMSPSSYTSDVVLIDEVNRVEMPYRIYMNNILKYKGYRFFQSSYDQDERGTILSVSHDFWGTFISYLGYFFLALGMVLTLVNKNSRFLFLLRRSKELKALRNAGKVASVLIVVLFVVNSLSAENNVISRNDYVKELNSLLVQDKNGRVEPLVTMSSEVLRKLHRSETFENRSSSEVLIGMLANPAKWQRESIIKISNGQLAKELGATSGYISFANLFDQNGYRIKNLVDHTYHKSPKSRNKYDKEIINLDERVNICYQIFQGNFIQFFPIPGDEQQKWATANNFPSEKIADGQINPVSVFCNYITEFNNAQLSHDWSKAQVQLQDLKGIQRALGSSIIQDDTKIKLEVLYNRLNLFGTMSRVYQTLGLILLILNFLLIFKLAWTGKRMKLFGIVLSSIAFVIYTSGIALRWYISGHAPWSNGYETMIFVGWATALAGLIFSRQSMITLAVTDLLAGMMLMVAGFSWMNPEITPLVPVLKSYWLIIHVAVITSSYGFLAIGALLGLLNLLLIIFQNSKNEKNVGLYIQEINIVIEISFLVGLIMLVIGSFLGGIWANESWGRYWGWDPKETWALITILVYSVVVHLKRIPAFKSDALFNALALISFSSVLMTFFGVNYYLSGLHSYAQGDAPPIPSGIYYATAIIIVIVSLAYMKETAESDKKTKFKTAKK